MNFVSINQIPKGAVKDGMSEEVYTPGFGYHYIHVYTKGIRRYFEITGWYTGKFFFSTSINNDRAEALRSIKDIADDLVTRWK